MYIYPLNHLTNSKSKDQMHFTNTGNPLLIYNIYSLLQLYISRLNKNIKSEKSKTFTGLFQ